MSSRRRRPEKAPDIEIGAAAKARRIRFRRKPKSKVDFEGSSRVRTDDRIEEVEIESDSRSERRNLPDEVEPGVTYRDVEVGWAAKARARMPEEDEEDDEDETRW
jgi:hypothetical protein